MLAVLMLVIVGSIAMTAGISLMGARMRQAEGMEAAVHRHVTWGNSRAVNQQYALTWATRDNVTRVLSSATLNGGGGVDADPLSAFKAFRSTIRPSNTAVTSFPFNNIRNSPTSDNGTFFERTTADSDNSQTEHLTFFNYLKTYPSPLLGDLLIVHKRAISNGTYAFSDNMRVNGRVVIWDESASTANIRAEDCINMTKTGTNTVKDTTSNPVPMLPQNFAANVSVTAGYGGAASPTAVADGTLNVINNSDFTPGSIRHIMEGTGMAGDTWIKCSTAPNGLANFDTDRNNNGSSSSPMQMKLDNSPDYPPPTASPYGYNKTGKLSVLYVRLKDSDLQHLRISNGVEQLVLQGQTTAADYTAAGTLDPVIIWLEQDNCRDIRFVGENNRRLILATGKGDGVTLYCAWHGNSIIGGSALRWRLQWINEYRNVYMDAPNGKGILITGGIRTDWSLNCTDSTSNVRFTIQRETAPGDLETLLPRDGRLEVYHLVR